MDESEKHPLRDEMRLPGNHAIEQRPVGPPGLYCLWVVAGDRVVCQRAYPLAIASCGEVLEGAHAKMAGCNAGEHGSRLGSFAKYTLSSRYGGKRAGGWHAEGGHGL